MFYILVFTLFVEPEWWNASHKLRLLVPYAENVPPYVTRHIFEINEQYSFNVFY